MAGQKEQAQGTQRWIQGLQEASANNSFSHHGPEYREMYVQYTRVGSTEFGKEMAYHDSILESTNVYIDRMQCHYTVHW